MTPFLSQTLIGGAVNCVFETPDVITGCQGYFEGLPCVASGTDSTDVVSGAARYTNDGRLRIVDATSALPSGAVVVDGFAFDNTGRLCVTYTAPSTTYYIGGIPVRSDGAVYIAPAFVFDFIQSANPLFPSGLTTTTTIDADGTYINSAGVITQKTTNVWPLDYDPATGTGPVGGFLPGVAGSYFSTPDSAAVSITGDIDIRVELSMNDWTPATDANVLSKFVFPGEFSYTLRVLTGGELEFTYSPDGTLGTLRIAISTVAAGLADRAIKHIRATLGLGGSAVDFYLSDDGATWAQLGATVAVLPGTIHDGVAGVEIGASNVGTGGVFPGTIYRAQIYSGIDGILVADFNPAAVPPGSPSFVSATGETWTVNGNARLGYTQFTPLGRPIWEARTNLLLNSLLNGTNLGTQAVVLAATPYALSAYGAGTVTLTGASTAGPLVGAGAYPSRAQLLFTPSAGAVTFTVASTIQYANLEAGGFPTPFIPTAGASVTRAADVASIAFNPGTQGTFVWEGIFSTISGFPMLFSVNDGTLNNRMYLYISVTGNLGCDIYSGGVVQASFFSANTITLNTVQRAAFSFGPDGFSLSLNGGAVSTAAAATVPTTTLLEHGALVGAFHLNGWLRKLYYYPVRLNNATLQSLST